MTELEAEVKRMRTALESIVRRWDHADKIGKGQGFLLPEQGGAVAFAMADDARTALLGGECKEFQHGEEGVCPKCANTTW